MPDTLTAAAAGDAWRYAERLHEPEAHRRLLQAALSALLTIRHARTKADPETMAAAVDWPALEAELGAALRAAGHPAGELGDAG